MTARGTALALVLIGTAACTPVGLATSAVTTTAGVAVGTASATAGVLF